MQRRAFITGFGVFLALWGAGAGTRAVAQVDEREAMQQDAVRVRLPDGSFHTVQGFELGDARQALAVRWSQQIPVFNENRVDLSGAGGGIGGLFRTPFRVRWARAVPLGDVALSGDTLVARVQDVRSFAGARVTVGAGDVSWDLPGSVSAAAAAVPGPGSAVGAIRVGEDGRLLVLLHAQPAF